jgi:UPF0755 protein
MISAIFSFFIFRSKALSSRVSDSNIAQLFEIEKNEGAKTIGIKLAEANLVKNKYYFYYYLRSENLTQKIQAGKYELSPNMSIQEITRKIVEGEIKEAYQKLVIPEGFTNTKIIGRVKELDLTLGEEFEKIVNCRCQTGVDCDCMNFRNKYSFLTNLPDGIDLEGYLFPDTYYVYPEDDAVKLVAKFINNFEEKVSLEMLQSIKKQDKTLHQILTMASIVEKEVRSDTDKKIVAGIFWNRVNDEYFLQSCATLAYVLGEDKKQYTIEDTKIDSSYNTYQNIGLPPGPVSNPGIKSIKATISPEKSDYYFFLSDFTTGETIFSKTLDEHNANKYKHGL